MKRILALAVLLLSIFAASPLSAQQSLERKTYQTFGSESDYEGKISNTYGHMEIMPNGGSYTQVYNNGTEVTRNIKITSFDGRNITFNSYSLADKYIGRFVGTYRNERIDGTFTNYKGGKVEFHMSCVGRWDDGWGSWYF